MQTTDTARGPRLLSARQLYGMLGAGREWRTYRTWLYRMARRGELVPVQTGPHSVAYIETEVEDWLRSRPRSVAASQVS